MNLNEPDPAPSYCWSFSHEDAYPYPVMPIQVQNPVNNQILKKKFKVDTGFNGVLGLSEEIIGIIQLEPAGTTTVRTAGGEQYLKYFKLEFIIPNTNLGQIQGFCIQTPRPIVGRAVLNLGNWIYYGKKQELCYF